MKVFALSWIVAAALALNLMLTGCSFQVGVGWHGETNLDNRTASPAQAKK
jgi:hypothetical protein